MWLFHGYMPEFNQKGEKMSGKQLKISEKKRFPVFTFLFFFILLCVAGFMFYMAFKEQVPYWISDFKSKQVQNEYTSFGEEADGTHHGRPSESHHRVDEFTDYDNKCAKDT